jgi:hypothetical protein
VGALGVAGCLNLLLGSLGEGNGEESEDVTIGGLGLDGGLNEGVPLLDHRASLILGDVHTIELGVAVETLDFLALELQLSPGLGLRVVVAIAEGDGENTASKRVRGLLLTSRLVAWCQCDGSFVKTWGKNVVPFLLDEWMGAIQISINKYNVLPNTPRTDTVKGVFNDKHPLATHPISA